MPSLAPPLRVFGKVASFLSLLNMLVSFCPPDIRTEHGPLPTQTPGVVGGDVLTLLYPRSELPTWTLCLGGPQLYRLGHG